MTQRATIKLNNDDFELEFGNETFIVTVNRDYWVRREEHAKDLVNYTDQAEKLCDAIKRKNAEIEDLVKAKNAMCKKTSEQDNCIDNLRMEISRLSHIDDFKTKRIDELSEHIVKLKKANEELTEIADVYNKQVDSLNKKLDEKERSLRIYEKVYEANQNLCNENVKLRCKISDLNAFALKAQNAANEMARSIGLKIE